MTRGRLNAIGLRVGRLAADGTLLTGAGNQYVTASLVRVNYSYEIEEGEETIKRNGRGDICVSDKRPDVIKWVNVGLEVCEEDPELQSILQGGTVFRSTIGTPTLAAPTTATTGGTLAAATYSYRVSAVGPNGEGAASGAQTITTTGTTSTVGLSWGTVTGATAYRVYGRVAGSEGLLAEVTGTTYTDTGAATPSGSVPTAASVTGYALPSLGGDPNPNGLFIEAWTFATQNGRKSTEAGKQFRRYIFPKVTGLVPTERTLAQEPDEISFEGGSGVANNSWRDLETGAGALPAGASITNSAMTWALVGAEPTYAGLTAIPV